MDKDPTEEEERELGESQASPTPRKSCPVRITHHASINDGRVGRVIAGPLGRQREPAGGWSGALLLLGLAPLSERLGCKLGGMEADKAVCVAMELPD